MGCEDLIPLSCDAVSLAPCGFRAEGFVMVITDSFSEPNNIRSPQATINFYSWSPPLMIAVIRNVCGVQDRPILVSVNLTPSFRVMRKERLCR